MSSNPASSTGDEFNRAESVLGQIVGQSLGLIQVVEIDAIVVGRVRVPQISPANELDNVLDLTRALDVLPAQPEQVDQGIIG